MDYMLKLCQPWSLLGWIVNIIEGPIPPISSKFFIFKLVKVISYMKKLPNHVTDITSNLLSKCATKESMFHRLHMVWTTMLATLVNCDWDPPSSFFHGIALLRTNQRKATSLCTLYLSQISLHLRDKEGEFSFFHLSWIDFLRVNCVVFQYLPSLAKYVKKIVTLGDQHLVESKKSWSNLPKNKIIFRLSL